MLRLWYFEPRIATAIPGFSGHVQRPSLFLIRDGHFLTRPGPPRPVRSDLALGKFPFRLEHSGGSVEHLAENSSNGEHHAYKTKGEERKEATGEVRSERPGGLGPEEGASL
jgi:hypothetical protein